MTINPNIVLEAGIALEPWRQNLLKAADLIRQHGLVKFFRGNEQDGYCMHGAIEKAMTGSTHTNNYETAREYEAIREQLRKTQAPLITNWGEIIPKYDWLKPEGIAGWNNLPDVTQDQVVSLMEAAALA